MANSDMLRPSVSDQAAANSDKDDILYNGWVLAQDSK
jgi:hypothetical protein